MLALARILAALLLIAAAPSARAASSDWQDLGGGKARMLASLDPATMKVSGVVEFALEPGWKTYWREPGASGIPPRFDFSGSRHFVAGEVAFPVPEHIVLTETAFVGYRDRVLFSFDGTALALAPDGVIRLDLLAGVCEEICIPATAHFEIPLGALMASDALAARVAIEAALALPGAPDPDFRVEKATATADRLDVTARVPDEAAGAELFVEGPAQWRLLPAVAQASEGRQRRFRLDLSRVPAGTDVAATRLRFTLVQGGRGIEQWLAPER